MFFFQSIQAKSLLVELDGPNKSKVYVLGTNHFSIKCREQVVSLIRHVKPNKLVLEMDETRRFSLDLDEKTLLDNLKLTPGKIFNVFLEVAIENLKI